MRTPSAETRLKNVLRELKHTHADWLTAQNAAHAYRARATRAEQEVAEWKARFDALLSRTPLEEK